MSSAAQIDYGAHAPTAAGGIDYGAHSAVAEDATPKTLGDHLQSFYDQTALFHPKEAAQGLVNTVLHPGQALKAYGEQNSAIAQRAQNAFSAGNYSEAARHALDYILQAVPGLGARLDAAGTKMSQGDIGGGLADTASIATDYIIGPKVAAKILDAATEPDAASKAVQPFKTAKAVLTDPEVIRKAVQVLPKGQALLDWHDAVTKAAARARDEAETVAVPAAIDPALDAAAVRLGAKDYASAEPAVQKYAEAMVKGAQARNAAPGGASGTAIRPQAVSSNPNGAPLRPPLAGTLDTGASVVSPVVNRPVNMSEPSPLGLNTVQSTSPAVEPPAYRRSYTSGNPAIDAARGSDNPESVPPKASVSRAVPPKQDITTGIVWDPNRGHIDTATGKAPTSEPQVQTIPFAKEMPPAEQFAAAARGTRAQNVAKLAGAMKDLGVDPETLPSILTDVNKAAQFRAVAKSLGIDLPKDITKTVGDLKTALQASKLNISDLMSQGGK
jgi:hypothetical protein